MTSPGRARASTCTTHHHACECREQAMRDFHYATWRSIDRVICGTVTAVTALTLIQAAVKEYEAAIGYDDEANDDK